MDSREHVWMWSVWSGQCRLQQDCEALRMRSVIGSWASWSVRVINSRPGGARGGGWQRQGRLITLCPAVRLPMERNVCVHNVQDAKTSHNPMQRVDLSVCTHLCPPLYVFQSMLYILPVTFAYAHINAITHSYTHKLQSAVISRHPFNPRNSLMFHGKSH